jgi:hypothetical protein
VSGVRVPPPASSKLTHFLALAGLSPVMSVEVV